MDISIFNSFHSLVGHGVFLDRTILFFAQYFIYFLGLVAFFFIVRGIDWRARFERGALMIFSVLVGWGIIASLLKEYINRDRPYVGASWKPLFLPNDPFSMPSGHAVLLFAIAGSIFAFNRRAGIWFSLGALLVCFGRIISGVHYPGDILAGAALGLIVSSLSFTLFHKYFHRGELI